MQLIEKTILEFNKEITEVKSILQLQDLKAKYIGKKGIITSLFLELKDKSIEEKKEFGALINKAQNQIIQVTDQLKERIELDEINQKLSSKKLDLSEPYRKDKEGFIHPLSKAIKDIKEILADLGFEFAPGPEAEDDFHNFSALNIPQNHPARQMQDTFYLRNSELMLRTHTSNTQIRKMIKDKPPLQVASLGKVYRRDFDQTHTPMFHQVEGFLVNQNVNMANLKWILETFLKRFFESEDLKLRFRPSFFPFTEPSAEVDINYKKDGGKITLGVGDKFMEILGCGMIHPNVLKNCEIDPEKYQGCAFGIGIERLAMLKYGITDLRMLYENDVRFIEYFGFSSFQY